MLLDVYVMLISLMSHYENYSQYHAYSTQFIERVKIIILEYWFLILSRHFSSIIKYLIVLLKCLVTWIYVLQHSKGIMNIMIENIQYIFIYIDPNDSVQRQRLNEQLLQVNFQNSVRSYSVLMQPYDWFNFLPWYVLPWEWERKHTHRAHHLSESAWQYVGY
jgi:hypothetical protein